MRTRDSIGRPIGWTAAWLVVAGIVACSSGPRPAPPPSAALNLVVITIDTLRADRVGAYGYSAARTPVIDALARRGARFERAYAPAPITLTSHASLFTGRYPPGHHARHNGMPLDPQAPLLADMLSKNGLSTGAFVAAFPLDARFGLARGFGTYSDRMPRAPDGRPANERPARIVIDEAVEWLDRHRGGRFFLWVHLFEPHSPYGGPGDPERSRLPAQARYDEEVAEADRQAGRLVDALGAESASTIVVLASDHGEAFGEHGEIGHSLFIYDTTLRVPLVLAGPGIPEGLTVADPVALIDVAPTMLRLLGVAGTGFDADGVDLAPALSGAALPNRELYAESFAPLFDFGWSGLRSLRTERWKFIAAPRPELYDLSSDANETANVVEREPALARTLAGRVEKYAGAEPVVASAPPDPEAASRLRSLGYASGHQRGTPSARPDPKDRRELALRLAQVASGEVAGRDLENVLTAILKDDPGNPQAHLRLGYVRLESNEVTAAKRHFQTAIDARLPGADGYLGLAECEARIGRRDAAARTLRNAERAEPNNPVVAANLGIVLAEAGRHAEGIAALERAVAIDPGFHQARFNLARVYARAGRRADAAAAARELLRRLPGDAPQRAEVERLLAAVQ